MHLQEQNIDEIAAKTGIILVAAGRGERAGGLTDGPKQYRSIADKPILTHTIEAFQNIAHFAQIIVVTHKDDDDLISHVLQQVNSDNIKLVHGGATRQQSALMGLEVLAEHNLDYVLIHDAVRPFISRPPIENSLNVLYSGECAVLPATAVTDTLKKADSEMHISETVSRDGLFAAQTPQGFCFSEIYNAHLKAKDAGKDDFTDDCAIAEWNNIPVKIIEGDRTNTKITTREDILLAEQKLLGALPDVRTGNGYDVHQLVDGDHVTLCGIDIPHNKSLSGHSDADVALHALTDALLATCGEGDIGDHFPPSDPQWKGAASHIFLEKAAEIVKSHGGTITNADVSLIAEQPKIGPHRLKMRESLAKILNIEIERCSVKATTNEKIGFIGREEGIAAIATATVVYGSKP